ncbi:aminoglycoside phosphotransferase family protein [Paenibacillus macquariensis]|uniref:Predicted kinase, aminoglycoside phosphotransferase (APT) family n=1 Tax=Paenibacillus macquariensis TaxID=948756 RepID=A0ABY1JZ18_9BACL|nr:aminoglycoside phosphotransferase family protein [Paenibacillus macquariensis]MEC0091216.1 aminoglycoside phosphotransferase family protein [Paenibacillus macquariensis]OAB37915.1 acetyltransferase [Paenibacillus macquariensis subsp. macquariensis]SIR01922.1 Predicted kinase, aminoglycoside phosphotransferase (APT) family [Paenibacillus macquariensis]
MININVDLVARLIHEQFPQWSDLDIKPVKYSGNDNRTFHLGEHMSVRLPSEVSYVPQVEKEQIWLPFLSENLSLPISTPLAKGNPSEEYPWPWSINKWLEGETLTQAIISDVNQFATDLGTFLIELQSIDASGGPLAGKHNFYRGGSVAVYDEESRYAIENVKDTFNEHILLEIWGLALDSKWDSEPVWVHGDIAPGNLLIKDGKLCAVIDFGILGVGDPASDAAMAWTFFDNNSRKIFKKVLNMDEGTWNRARGWALWKALITYNGHKDSNDIIAEESYHVIHIIIDDYLAEKITRNLEALQ